VKNTQCETRDDKQRIEFSKTFAPTLKKNCHQVCLTTGTNPQLLAHACVLVRRRIHRRVLWRGVRTGADVEEEGRMRFAHGRDSRIDQRGGLAQQILPALWVDLVHVRIALLFVLAELLDFRPNAALLPMHVPALVLEVARVHGRIMIVVNVVCAAADAFHHRARAARVRGGLLAHIQ
jgi:hypothetical protein